MLLAVGLATKEARERALATDALVAAIEDGRLVGPELGAAMSLLWHPLQLEMKRVQRPTASRWAGTLGTAARVSPLHAEVVRRALAQLAHEAPSTPPPDLHALLSLWRELCEEAETGVAKGAARTWLESLAQGGKTKKARDALLALPERPSRLAAEAHALALEARWTRAARWAAWRRAASDAT